MSCICTNIEIFKVDWIIAWLMADPNTQFIEILPEVSIRMALGLKNYMLCRAAFSILVSEEALSLASREAFQERGGEGPTLADRRGTNQFGRIREDVDEDLRTIIEYASKIFASRVSETLEVLTEEEMSWVTQLPEYQKVQKFKAGVLNGLGNKKETQKWLSAVDQLSFGLRQYVRSRILVSLETGLSPEESTKATNHRLAERYTSKINPVNKFDRSFSITYRELTAKERIFTRFFWTSVLHSDFPIWIHGQPPRDSDPDMSKAYSLGVRPKVRDLQDAQKKLNTSIMEAINAGFDDGIMPAEAFPNYNQWNPPTSSTLSARDGSGHNGWVPKVRHTGNTWNLFDKFWNGSSSSNANTGDDKDTSTNVGESSGNPHETIASMSGALDPEYGWERASRFSETSPLIPNDAVSNTITTNVNRRKSGAGWEIMDEDEYLAQHHLLDPITDVEKLALPATGRYLPIRPKIIDHPDRDIEKALLSERDRTVFPAAEPTEPLAYGGLIWTPDEPDSSGQSEEQKKTSPPNKSSTKGYSVLRPMMKPLPRTTIPGDDSIPAHSAFFNMTTFFLEAKEHIRGVANRMLDTKEMGFDIAITDTLLCLGDDEFRYLPLWAGGNDDESGGVFDDNIPAALAGPNGPGPSFHTGFSNPSAASSEFDTISERASFNTSMAVDDGFSDHIDRRIVIADDDFHSETFSEDSEVYDRKGKGVDRGGFSQSSEVALSDAGSDLITFSEADTETLAAEPEVTPEADFEMEYEVEDSDTNTTVGQVDDHGEDEPWDGGDAESFDFGDNESDEEMSNA